MGIPEEIEELQRRVAEGDFTDTERALAIGWYEKEDGWDTPRSMPYVTDVSGEREWSRDDILAEICKDSREGREAIASALFCMRGTTTKTD